MLKGLFSAFFVVLDITTMPLIWQGRTVILHLFGEVESQFGLACKDTD